MWFRRLIKIIATMAASCLCAISVSADIVFFENPAQGEEGHFDWQLHGRWDPEVPENWLNITRPSTEQFEMGTGSSIGQLYFSADLPNVTRFGAETGIGEGMTWAFEFGEDIASTEFNSFAAHVITDGPLRSEFEEGALLYMGVHTENDNYGWIAVIRQHTRFHTTGWAYETTPGKTILAGEIPAPGAVTLFGIILLVRKRRRAS